MLSAIPDQTVTTTFSDDDIGENFNLYLVNGYVGAAVQTSESASNYSLVIAKNNGTAGVAFNELKLQIVNAEGTISTITVSDDSAKKLASDYTVGDIIVYTGDASNAVVTIKSAGLDNRSYSDSTKAFDGKVTTADCVLFAETTANTLGNAGAKYKVYDIRTLDSFGPVNTNYVVNSDGKVVAVFAELASTPAGATSNTVYGIVTAANGRVKIDDNYYYQYTVASNEETYTVNMANNSLTKGELVAFEPVNDNVYSNTDVDKIDGTGTSQAVYVKEYSDADKTLTYFTAKTVSDGSYIGVAGTLNTLAVDEDCSIVYVDAKNDAAGSDMGINAFDSVTGYKNVAIVTKTVDGAKVIVAIFVETSNETDILGVADSNVLDDAALGDVLDELANSGTAIVTGNIPAGEINAEGKDLTLKNSTISGQTKIGGSVTIAGNTTIGGSAKLESQQVDLGSDVVLNLADGSNLTYMVLTAKAGAKIVTAKADFQFTSDVYIDVASQTINNYPYSTVGLISALQTAAAQGLGNWTRLEA